MPLHSGEADIEESGSDTAITTSTLLQVEDGFGHGLSLHFVEGAVKPQLMAAGVHSPHCTTVGSVSSTRTQFDHVPTLAKDGNKRPPLS